MDLMSAGRGTEDDSDDDGEGEERRVEEPGHDGHGRDTGETGSHEQLCTVGQDTLDTAAGGVQQRCGASRVDMELLCYPLGDVADREDGDGVIGGTDVSKRHQRADAPFGTGTGLDAPRDGGADKLQSAVMPDQGKDATG